MALEALIGATPAQAETLSLVLAGHTDQQIATELDQPSPLVRDEVALLIERLTTRSPRVGRQGSGTT